MKHPRNRLAAPFFAWSARASFVPSVGTKGMPGIWLDKVIKVKVYQRIYGTSWLMRVYLAKVCLICSKQYAFLSFLALYFSRFLWHAYHRLPSPWQWTKSPCYPMLAGWIRNKRGGPLTQLDYRPLFLLRLRSISPKFRYHHCNYG